MTRRWQMVVIALLVAIPLSTLLPISDTIRAVVFGTLFVGFLAAMLVLALRGGRDPNGPPGQH